VDHKLLSIVSFETGPICGFSVGVWRSQPDPVPGEKLPETSQLAQGSVLNHTRITLEKKEKSGRSRIGRTLFRGKMAEGV
jgi:hypothetical protein